MTFTLTPYISKQKYVLSGPFIGKTCWLNLCLKEIKFLFKLVHLSIKKKI